MRSLRSRAGAWRTPTAPIPLGPDEALVDRGDGEQHRRPLVLDIGGEPSRLEPGVDHRPRSREQRGVHAAEPVLVREREGVQEHVLGVPPPGEHRRADRRQQVRVRERHALGSTGRPRGERQYGGGSTRTSTGSSGSPVASASARLEPESASRATTGHRSAASVRSVVREVPPPNAATGSATAAIPASSGPASVGARGTAVAPTRSVARYATTSAREFGAQSSTRSPGSTPCVRSHPATRAARSSRSPWLAETPSIVSAGESGRASAVSRNAAASDPAPSAASSPSSTSPEVRAPRGRSGPRDRPVGERVRHRRGRER